MATQTVHDMNVCITKLKISDIPNCMCGKQLNRIDIDSLTVGLKDKNRDQGTTLDSINYYMEVAFLCKDGGAFSRFNFLGFTITN